MFDIGWGELVLIGIVALIAIGPKELPGALRTLGQWTGKIRRMAGEFQNQFHEAMREAELADLKKEVDEMAAKAQSYAHYDPLDDVRKDIESAAGPLPDLNAPPPSGTYAAEAPTSTEPAPAPTETTASAALPESSTPPTAATEPVEMQPTAPKSDASAPDAPKPDAGRAA
jgi:sec-independent protein translocase protein TatB